MRPVFAFLLYALSFLAVACVPYVQSSPHSIASAERVVAYAANIASSPPTSSQTEQAKESLAYLLSLIDERYYRPRDVVEVSAPAYKKMDAFVDKSSEQRSFSLLIGEAKKGIVEGLDKNSTYYTADEFSAFQESLSGNFGGIGAQVKKHELGVVIIPIPTGAATKAGMREGDVITHAGAVSLAELSLPETVKKLRGKVGTRISLTVHRPGADAEGETLHFSVTRALVHIISVVARVEDGIGYFDISSFHDETDDLVDEALQKMEGQKLQGYILDLRGNLGGLLQQAYTLSDYFLDKGLIVSVRGRGQDEQFSASSYSTLTHRPVVVLQDRATASSSEILAAALSGHGRAHLIGDTTFGKGTVQTVIGLHDGEGVRLTTARYYSPRGIDIEGRGIVPDERLVDDPKTQEDEVFEAAKAYLKALARQNSSGVANSS